MFSFTFFIIKIYHIYSTFIPGKLFLEKTPLNLDLLLKYLVISILLKGWSGNKKILSVYHSSSCSSNFSYTYFLLLKKLAAALMKHLKLLTKNKEICLLVLFIIIIISCFPLSATPSINIFESSSDFMILIISFISSFKINKVNPFLALTAPFPPFFQNYLFHLKLNYLIIQVNHL